MIDILVVSHACFTALNRSVYRTLMNSGFSVEIVVPDEIRFSSGIHHADTERQGDPPVHFYRLIGDSPRLYRFHGLLALLKKKAPKVVYLDNDPISWLAYSLGKWCNKNNAKLICQSCENLPFDILSSIKRNGVRAIVPALLKTVFLFLSRNSVDHVFCINSDGERIFKGMGYKSVSRIPLGFDEEVFNINRESRNRIRSELNITTHVVAYFGRLLPEKGVHLLLEALSTLKHLEWVLMIDRFDIYSNEYSRKLGIMIEKLNLGERVIYIDADHVGIADYMNAADLIVMPSISTPKWKEQYGRVAPEAMACGKLVVAASSGALPELIGDAGILFDEGDVNSLSSIIENILTNSSVIEQYNVSANTRAMNLLSVKSQAGSIKKLYEENFMLT